METLPSCREWGAKWRESGQRETIRHPTACFFKPLRLTWLFTCIKKKWRSLARYMFMPILSSPVLLSVYSPVQSFLQSREQKQFPLHNITYIIYDWQFSSLLCWEKFQKWMTNQEIIFFPRSAKRHLLCSQECGRVRLHSLFSSLTHALFSCPVLIFSRRQSQRGKAFTWGLGLCVENANQCLAMPVLMWTREWAETIKCFHMKHETVNRWPLDLWKV